MIRFLLLVSLTVTGSLAAKSDIDQQIKQTSKQISSFDEEYSSLHKKMAEVAKKILRQKRAILKQQKAIGKLMDELSEKEAGYEANKNELQELQKTQQALQKEQVEIEIELVDSVARTVSLSLLIDDERAVTAESLITEEILKELNLQTQNKIASLQKHFEQNTERIGDLEQRTHVLETAIAEIDKKRKKLLSSQQANKRALAKLTKNRESYKRSLNKLMDQKKELKKTLANLNIIKEDEAERAAREKERKSRLASKNLPSIKNVGSSYQAVRTKRYSGKKTIAPLDTYTLVKQYGPYTDPIYNIKIYNESVSLKPRRSDAKVKSVLNGKVILAQNTPLLDNVVIIEHSNGLHTIYAHLDRIAPTVKKGKRIRKGSVIGRVNNELMFEVTQNNYHINPMQLIR
jgi:murein DD-endopeptidase MepM/ murein hydrolase activator NlpD